MTTQQAQKGMSVIQSLALVLIGPNEPAFINHCGGVETGLRLAFRHPEYARLVLRLVDEEMEADGQDAGRLSAERAIDGVIQACPLEDSA